MREIIHIQGGQAGNQIGAKFWEVISLEHGIYPDGKYKGESYLQSERLNVYYNERKKDIFVPRAILFDLESTVIDQVQNSRFNLYGKLFSPQNAIRGNFGAGNNWAKGFHSEGREVIDQVMDAVRNEVENCDYPQGFQYVSAAGGGTGSGLGSLLLTKLQEEYADLIVSTFSLMPNTVRSSETILEPYNALLFQHYLIDNSSATTVLDNGALGSICKKLGLGRASYEDFNHLIAATMSGTTSSMRFPGQLNADLRKLATNMVPFPRLHFFVTSFSPLFPKGNKTTREKLSVATITKQIFNPHFLYAEVDSTRGKYLTAAAIYRGRVSTREVDEYLANIQSANSAYFVDWIPNHIKTVICDIPPTGVRMSGSFLGNSTAIRQSYAKLSNRFRKLYSRKAYLHWYINEGMEEADLSEGSHNLMDLMSEYQEYEGLVNDIHTPDEPVEGPGATATPVSDAIPVADATSRPASQLSTRAPSAS